MGLFLNMRTFADHINETQVSIDSQRKFAVENTKLKIADLDGIIESAKNLNYIDEKKRPIDNAVIYALKYPRGKFLTRKKFGIPYGVWFEYLNYYKWVPGLVGGTIAAIIVVIVERIFFP